MLKCFEDVTFHFTSCYSFFHNSLTFWMDSHKYHMAMSQETKDKISRAKKGKPSKLKGRKRPVSVKQKISKGQFASWHIRHEHKSMLKQMVMRARELEMKASNDNIIEEIP